MGASVSSRPVLSMRVIDRETGELVSEMVPGYLRSIYLVMYQNPVGRQLIRTSCVRSSLARATARHGLKMDDPASVSAIPEFVRTYGVIAEEAELEISEYKTFNDFFSRRLKPGVRPIASPSDPSVMVSPADCRILVYPSVSETQQFWLKGQSLSIPELLGAPFAHRTALYSDPAVVICRLAPQDYHRWHLPIDARVGKAQTVAGTYYSVSPRAVRNCNILAQNKRVVCEFESKEFGWMLLISIGAAMVSSIVLMDDMIEGKEAKKGDMHGMFRFGGSTLVLLFADRTRVEFDDDLIRNSRQGMETLIRCGTQMGVTRGHVHPPHQPSGQPVEIERRQSITDADTGEQQPAAIISDLPMSYDSMVETIMHPLEDDPEPTPVTVPRSPAATSSSTHTSPSSSSSDPVRKKDD